MDAVPGRIAPEAIGSSHDHTYCQPCAEDGKRILPDAFCTVCMEFLCSTCARVHRNMKLTKSHALQDKSSMPSSFHAESEDETFTETCQFHAKEFIKYYCPNHEALLCGESVVDNEEHRSCKVKKISQLAKQFKEGAEYKSLKTGIVQMVSDIENYSSFIQASMKSVEEESLTNINELRKFRHEINQLLDKREKELFEEIDRKKRESETLLNEMKANCQDLKTATENLKAKLQAKEVNNNQLFVSGTRAINELVGLQSSLEDIRRRGKVPHSKFSRDPATGQLLYSNTAIGRVDQVASDLADQQEQPQRPVKQDDENKQEESQQQQRLLQEEEERQIYDEEQRRLLQEEEERQIQQEEYDELRLLQEEEERQIQQQDYDDEEQRILLEEEEERQILQQEYDEEQRRLLQEEEDRQIQQQDDE